MEKIVYIFGAGFSAPRGLPVMSNFIEKSKDMYFSSDNYRHFDAIYSLIKEVAYLKNFINCDLHNIEEILSILEMGHFVGDNSKELENYKRFIKDVIKYYTPRIELNREIQKQSNWYSYCFGENELDNYYGWFISNLLQIKLCELTEREYPDFKDYYSEIEYTSKAVDYGIITLNYDLVIENVLNFINEYYPLKGQMKYEVSTSLFDLNNEFNKLKIAKLHGCMLDDIIPPTWNKSSAQNDYIRNAWKLAYEMLVDANQIRIIGYSMPVTDSYIKYLLSVAFKNSKHLKKIDVITLDGDNKTYERYEKLFSFPKFQFKNKKFEDFLKHAYDLENTHLRVAKRLQKNPIRENVVSEIHMHSTILENAHEKFMES